MRKITHYRYDILAVLLSFLVSVVNFLFLRPSWSLQFDSQMLLIWHYAAYSGLVPFRDIFYPYGLLYYYKDHVLLFSVLYNLFPPFLLIGYYTCFKKIFKNSLFSTISLFVLALLTLFYVHVETLSRYGIFVLFTLFISILFWEKRYIPRAKVYFIGVVTGLLFSLTLDQGVYTALYSIVLISIHPLLKSGISELKKLKYLNYVIRSMLILLVGFITGVVPLLIYLLYNSMLVEFIDSFFKLSDTTLYAKTPYFHSLRSWEGLVNIIVIIISVTYLSFRLFFLNRKITLSVYAIFSLLFALILLEQKSIIRSIDNQLTFIGVLLCFVLIYQICTQHLKSKLSSKIIVILFFTVLFLTLLKPLHFFYDGKIVLSKNNIIYDEKSRKKITQDVLVKNQEYNEVVRWIKSKNAKAKVFTFPSDSIFYILFNQRPPYYLTSYESSPLYAQKRQIDYIRKNVDFVIYNSSINAVQDGVPDRIRTKKLYEFINNEFKKKRRIKEFVILSK